MAMNKIKKGDTVRVIAGKNKGAEGKVLEVKKGKVKVENVAMVQKHQKPSQMNPQGGIVSTEAFIDASNVMYVVNGQVTRVGFVVDETGKHRVAKKTGAIID